MDGFSWHRLGGWCLFLVFVCVCKRGGKTHTSTAKHIFRLLPPLFCHPFFSTRPLCLTFFSLFICGVPHRTKVLFETVLMKSFRTVYCRPFKWPRQRQESSVHWMDAFFYFFFFPADSKGSTTSDIFCAASPEVGNYFT